MKLDPVVTNPNHWCSSRTTTNVTSSNSVMDPLGSFRRGLYSGDAERDVDIGTETTSWLPAQQHSGHNIGDTPTHVISVELKDSAARPTLDRCSGSELNHRAQKDPDGHQVRDLHQGLARVAEPATPVRTVSGIITATCGCPTQARPSSCRLYAVT